MSYQPKHSFLVIVAFLVILSLACNLLNSPRPAVTNTSSPPAITPPPPATPVPTAIPPPDTQPSPTFTSEPAPTSVDSPSPLPVRPGFPSNSPVITVQNLNKLQVLASVHFEEGGFYEAGLAFSPDGDRLAFATDRGEITVLEVSTGEVLDVLANTEGDVGVYPDVAFSPPDGRYLAATGRTWVDEYGEYWSAVMVWDLTNMDKEPLTLIGTSHWAKTGVTFSPEGSRLMVGTREGMGGGGSVKIWDTASGKNQLDIPAMDWITDVSVFPDGSILAGSSYGIVILWDAFTGEELNVFQVGEGPLWGVSFSPDGNLLAVRSGLSVYLLNPGTGEILSSLDGQNEITSMAFSPNGRMLVTADGQTIRLWDITTSEELAIRETEPDPVLSVTFSPDGRAIASATAEGVVYLWGVGP